MISPTLPPDLRPVALPQAYRLMNHGPTVLVSAAHGGVHNVMAAAWAMPLDFDPPKVAVVIDKATRTRALIEASGRFVLSIPCVAIAQATLDAGSLSAHQHPDKLARHGPALFSHPEAPAPLVQGAVGWLACRVIADDAARAQQQRHDLFIAEVSGAWADGRVFEAGRWHFERADPALRTLHYVAGGRFYAIGEPHQLQAPTD